MAAIPDSMRIVEVAEPGGPENLRIAERPTPTCGPDEVLIRLAAAGINRPDILQRRGHYPPPPGAPAHPGLEVAGTIVAIGAGVREFKINDVVCALLQGGGYAEYCAVNEGQVLPIPEPLSVIEAAALPEACFTVWSNLYDFARLRAGESMLVHGGSSGIGTCAIQLARALGSVVYATAGTDDKVAFCEKIGAQRAINYKSRDFVAEILALTDGRGVDVVLDMVGGSYLERNLQVLGSGGRLAVIAVQGGRKGTIDLMQLLQRRWVISGSLLRPRATQFKRQIRDQLLAQVWPLLRAGKVKPIVDRVFGFDEAAAAHAYMESGAHKGKIVLRVAQATNR